MIAFIASIVFAYLLGSISSSFIAGKLAAGVDIREHGSGNAGATNTLRVLGWKLGIVVLVADVAKGVLAIAFAQLVSGGSLGAMAFAGLFAVVGHNWPVYFGFRGGKGVATTIGVLGTFAFFPTLYAVLAALVLLLFLRYVSLSSMVLVSLTPFLELFWHTPAWFIVITFVIAIVVDLRHLPNIDRLRNHREPKLFGR
jgi:glycerol-3-phosphate acyltransferase PlsY